MKTMAGALALVLLTSATTLAFEPETEAVTTRYKAQKLVSASDIGTLMRTSERWCYAEEDGQCSWSDIYLDVTDTDARFEISNAWSGTIDLSFVDRGVFNDKNQICETGEDWGDTVHARERADGTAVTGRELQAIKDELLANRNEPVIDCFDYLYQSADPIKQTVTLLQRQYTGDMHQPDADVVVTLHFDPASAKALQLRW
jgi:hypothetical protein